MACGFHYQYHSNIVFTVLEILTDVTYSSALYEENIEQQRGVILREMEEIEKHNHEVCNSVYMSRLKFIFHVSLYKS